MSSSEVIVIMVVALVLFGGKRLPELFRAWGRIMREFRRSYETFKRQIGMDVDDLDDIFKKKK